ncbi:MAG: S-layer homology domain-containing protein [Oscillospiraceae bacterium]
MKRKFISALLTLALLLGTAAAVPAATLDPALADSAQYILKTVQDPQVGTIGGEWAILGLARSGCPVPEDYFARYYRAVEKSVAACKGELHEKKYTEYSRVIVALTAIGRDPRSVGGYNLLTPLGDYEKTIWQGVNGPIWALIALDSGNYEMPKNPAAKTQATRESYVRRILDCQLPDGGWSLSGGSADSFGGGVSDPDITGMALQALAKYQENPAVKKATQQALSCLSKQQDADGGFASWGITNSESCVHVLVALCELGLPLDDARFVKNGKTLLENLLTYYRPGKGFAHTPGGEVGNQMASEQGLYALSAAVRLREKLPSLYRMTSPLPAPNAPDGAPQKGGGLPGKNPAVQSQPVLNPGKTFADISAHKNRAAIETLAARGIVDGKTAARFDPSATMTRSEFAAIAVKALGLTPKAVPVFADVPADAWYAPMVGAAYQSGIITGTDKTHFAPLGTITKQEAAVMLARAAKLCGMDTAMSAIATRDVLAIFTDYTTSADWARPSLAFCYQSGIFDPSDEKLDPGHQMQRGEIAQALSLLLDGANLL